MNASRFEAISSKVIGSGRRRPAPSWYDRPGPAV